ncbi:hypothetical protein Ancab_025709 [Ancistrocladus abbreviatus]
MLADVEQQRKLRGEENGCHDVTNNKVSAHFIAVKFPGHLGTAIELEGACPSPFSSAYQFLMGERFRIHWGLCVWSNATLPRRAADLVSPSMETWALRWGIAMYWEEGGPIWRQKNFRIFQDTTRTAVEVWRDLKLKLTEWFHACVTWKDFGAFVGIRYCFNSHLEGSSGAVVGSLLVALLALSPVIIILQLLQKRWLTAVGKVVAGAVEL